MAHPGLDPSRALATLQALLAIPAGDLGTALTHACDAITEAFSADKVDAFMYDESRDSLAALGVSTQRLSNLQRGLGLDVLPLSNGGRAVTTYTSGKPFRSGRTLQDPDELRGIKEGLKVASTLAVPLPVGSKVRGVLMITSLKPDFFTEGDEAFAVAAANWVGMVAHRSELMEEIGRNALEQGRQAAAEELVTVLAHDVRNYLAPISTNVYLLRQQAEKREDEEGQKHARSALRSIQGLSQLVTNLLDVARIDRGLFDLDLEPVDLCELAQESASMISSPSHPVVVKASNVVVVSGDRVRLRQCVDNLVTNAAAHSPRGAPVNVFIDHVDADGTTFAQLQVIDEGPGVPDEVLPHLFERFVTGRAKSGGVGLGLYLANRIVRAHGGEVSVDSAPGKGTRFKLKLPLYEASKGGPAEP